jgi:hypothetical protein
MTFINEISDKKTRVFISDLYNNIFLHIVIIMTGVLVLILDLLSQVLIIQEIFIINKLK